MCKIMRGNFIESMHVAYAVVVDGSGNAVTVSYCAGSCDTTCGGGDTDVYGCLDANATNYNPDATVQEEDQWGNLVCVYASCDDVPYDGCTGQGGRLSSGRCCGI